VDAMAMSTPPLLLCLPTTSVRMMFSLYSHFSGRASTQSNHAL